MLDYLKSEDKGATVLVLSLLLANTDTEINVFLSDKFIEMAKETKPFSLGEK